MEMCIMKKLITWQDDILKKLKLILVFFYFLFQTSNIFASERWVLDKSETKSLNVLLRGAAVRILVTRLHDMIYHPKNALVIPKDPKEYMQILEWHQENLDINL